ncbi:MAG: hypothetical protein E7316_00300 [Clostridiales bacterium]|nr:hypothetical protein [Clostridiales bacterium]
MEEMYRWHRRHYPAMEPQDVVKLYFQAMLGCGHLLGDEDAVAQRIAVEQATLTPSPAESLTEPLGPDYVRLNLRRAKADGLEPLWIARLMKLSAETQQPARADVMKALSSLGDASIDQAAQRLMDDPAWLPSHTQTYHAAYAPAYRVISRKFDYLLPALQRIVRLRHQDRVLICIDGPCGSGKTTLAGLLKRILAGAVVSMDDFFLPHPQKTPERLAQPGGNADWERLVGEFLTPWLQQGSASYRPYDCHANDFGDEIRIPACQYTIIEGSYSLMPAIAGHADLKLFLRIDPEEQKQRILQRNGEKLLQMFVSRWIPLEQAYFSAFSLPDDGCVVLAAQSQR